MPWDSDFDVKLYTEADITMEGPDPLFCFKGNGGNEGLVLGPPARCPFFYQLCWGRVPLLKKIAEKNGYPNSNLSTGGPRVVWDGEVGGWLCWRS